MDTTAVGDHAVVQQRTLSLLYRVQPTEQIGILLHMDGVDLLQFGVLGRVPPMMRQIVVSFRDVDERIGHIAAFVREDKGRYTRTIGLKGKHQEIAHEAYMLLEVCRN